MEYAPHSRNMKVAVQKIKEYNAKDSTMICDMDLLCLVSWYDVYKKFEIEVNTDYILKHLN